MQKEPVAHIWAHTSAKASKDKMCSNIHLRKEKETIIMIGLYYVRLFFQWNCSITLEEINKNIEKLSHNVEKS